MSPYIGLVPATYLYLTMFLCYCSLHPQCRYPVQVFALIIDTICIFTNCIINYISSHLRLPGFCKQPLQYIVCFLPTCINLHQPESHFINFHNFACLLLLCLGFCFCFLVYVVQLISANYLFQCHGVAESFTLLHILKLLFSYLFRDLKMSQHVQLKTESLNM